MFITHLSVYTKISIVSSAHKYPLAQSETTHYRVHSLYTVFFQFSVVYVKFWLLHGVLDVQYMRANWGGTCFHTAEAGLKINDCFDGSCISSYILWYTYF